MSTGAATEPSATATSVTLSIAANARASTASGTARCNSVSPATSTIVLPTPTSAKAAKATQASGHRPTSEERHAPEQQSHPEVGPELRARDEHRGRDAADDATDTERRVEQAHAGGAEVERLEGEHDDQDTERAVDERLHGEEPRAAP